MSSPKPTNRPSTHTRRRTPSSTLEAAALRALAMRGAFQGSNASAPAPIDIIRFRPKGQADRRIKVEYLADQEHPGSVLMRLTPLSETELPSDTLLSTQHVADLLGVSRPYVVKLVENNAFQGVIRTAAGHRRIPQAEAERVQAEMAQTRHQALLEIEVQNQDLRQHELEDARQNASTHWARPTR